MRVLFIGGTGIISSACAALAVERGLDLTLLNRGETTRRLVPAGATVLKADVSDRESVRAALGDRTFDAVVNFIAFTPDQIQADIDTFAGRTGQYVFISSATVYRRPPTTLPITESVLRENRYWPYAENKIACENRLIDAYRDDRFPMTIVRPSHTYDKTLLPFWYGYTVVHRMRQGKPVIVHGDGTSLWTMTHHSDLARGLIGLLGNPQAIGEAFHITADELLTWNQITDIVADAAGTTADIVHVPSDLLAAYDADWGEALVGDKTHSFIFDNSKIKRVVPDFVATVPFAKGAREVMAWYDADPARQTVDAEIDAMMDRIIADYRSIWPK